MNQSIVDEIRSRFSRIAVAPDQEETFPVGPQSAKNLGYDPAELDALPRAVTESFCGVGNPISLGKLRRGETVLDLGSGAGLDSILAASRVGESGKVIGVDMTPQMIDKANHNVRALGLTNVEFRHGQLNALPVSDDSVDVVITNGVFNLCVEKTVVLDEAYRVLRPDGRMQMADILLHEDVSSDELESKGQWSD